ncbi:MAG TPA: hypothetical protein VMV69_01860 [Pirellulales bacterium]|nr:hypothetical protein [Pirellulales bacterium]
MKSRRVAQQRGFGAAETAQEKTGKTVPVPTRKSVSADCPALDALRLLPPQRPFVPDAPMLSSGKGTVLPVFSDGGAGDRVDVRTAAERRSVAPNFFPKLVLTGSFSSRLPRMFTSGILLMYLTPT